MDSYSIVLSVQDLVVIDKALQQMPYHEAARLINIINKQIVKQQSEQKSSTALDENGVEIL